MNNYLLHGKLTAKQGQRDELVAILLDASRLLATAKGCKLYAVGLEDNDEHSVFITEIWDSKADHDNSLKGEGIRALIAKAMPMLGEMPTKGQEIAVLGGVGV